MSLFIASAHAQAAGQSPQGGGELFQIFFLVGLFVLFYFIAITTPAQAPERAYRDGGSA